MQPHKSLCILIHLDQIGPGILILMLKSISGRKMQNFIRQRGMQPTNLDKKRA